VEKNTRRGKKVIYSMILCKYLSRVEGIEIKPREGGFDLPTCPNSISIRLSLYNFGFAWTNDVSRRSDRKHVSLRKTFLGCPAEIGE
jgi:hypothetical protein